MEEIGDFSGWERQVQGSCTQLNGERETKGKPKLSQYLYLYKGCNKHHISCGRFSAGGAAFEKY